MEEQVNVIIWDIETIPDLQGFAAANYLTGKTDAEIRDLLLRLGESNCQKLARGYPRRFAPYCPRMIHRSRDLSDWRRFNGARLPDQP